MRVLLIVDLQNDFCPGGALAVPEGDAIVPLVNRLLRDGRYDLRIGTLDWHPTDHASFADNHPGAALFEQRTVDGVLQVLWPRHCVQGSHGAELHAELDAHLIDYIVKKGTHPRVDSYSAFFDNARQHATELMDILRIEAAKRGQQIQDVEIDVVGLALDYCVAFSALDARELGCKTTVLVDASRAVNLQPGDDLKTMRNLVDHGIAVECALDRLPALERSASREREL